MGALKKLTKIGNSYGVILPKELLDQLGIDEKTEMEVELRENELALKPIRMKDYKVMKTFLSVVRDYDKTFKKLAEEQ